MPSLCQSSAVVKRLSRFQLLKILLIRELVYEPLGCPTCGQMRRLCMHCRRIVHRAEPCDCERSPGQLSALSRLPVIQLGVSQ